MANLLDRVGTLISANLNYIVTQALKANSMAVLDEYIRRVEDNLEALEDAAATVGGDAKTLRRKQQEFQAQVDQLDRNINTFLKQGDENLAVAAQSRYNTIKRLADTYQQQAESQEAEYQKLLNARMQLEAKLNESRQERTELQAMLELAKAKEQTHKTVEGVAGVTSAESGMKEIRDEIQRRLDKATTQSEMDASRLDKQMADALEKNTIQDQLAERKKRLGM